MESISNSYLNANFPQLDDNDIQLKGSKRNVVGENHIVDISSWEDLRQPEAGEKSGSEILQNSQVKPGFVGPRSLKQKLEAAVEKRYTLLNRLSTGLKTALRHAAEFFGRTVKGFFNLSFKAPTLEDVDRRLEKSHWNSESDLARSKWKESAKIVPQRYEADDVGTALGLRGPGITVRKFDVLSETTLMTDITWKPSDIKQDPGLQDCWFLSSLSAVLIAKGQHALKDLVKMGDGQPPQVALVKLGKDVYEVPLGDIVDSSGRKGVSDSAGWVKVFETAMQMHLIKHAPENKDTGDFYTNASGPQLFLRNVQDGIAALMGVGPDQSERDLGTRMVRTNVQISYVEAALKAGNPVVLGSPSGALGKLMAVVTGIAPGHAVSVLDVNRANHTITVMDPYGHATVLSEEHLDKFTMITATPDLVQAKEESQAELDELDNQIKAAKRSNELVKESSLKRQRSVLLSKFSCLGDEQYFKGLNVDRMMKDESLSHLFNDRGFAGFLNRMPVKYMESFAGVCKTFLPPSSDVNVHAGYDNVRNADAFMIALADKIADVDKIWHANSGNIGQRDLLEAMFGKAAVNQLENPEGDFLPNVRTLLEGSVAGRLQAGGMSIVQNEDVRSVFESVKRGMSLPTAIAFALQDGAGVSLAGLESKELLSFEEIDNFSEDLYLGPDFGSGGATVKIGSKDEVRINQGDKKADISSKVKEFIGYNDQTKGILKRQYAAIMMSMRQVGHALFKETGVEFGAPQNYTIIKEGYDQSVDVTFSFPPYRGKDKQMHSGGHMTVNIKVDGTNTIKDFGIEETSGKGFIVIDSADSEVEEARFDAALEKRALEILAEYQKEGGGFDQEVQAYGKSTNNQQPSLWAVRFDNLKKVIKDINDPKGDRAAAFERFRLVLLDIFSQSAGGKKKDLVPVMKMVDQLSAGKFITEGDIGDDFSWSNFRKNPDTVRIPEQLRLLVELNDMKDIDRMLVFDVFSLICGDDVGTICRLYPKQGDGFKFTGNRNVEQYKTFAGKKGVDFETFVRENTNRDPKYSKDWNFKKAKITENEKQRLIRDGKMTKARAAACPVFKYFNSALTYLDENDLDIIINSGISLHSFCVAIGMISPEDGHWYVTQQDVRQTMLSLVQMLKSLGCGEKDFGPESIKQKLFDRFPALDKKLDVSALLVEAIKSIKLNDGKIADLLGEDQKKLFDKLKNNSAITKGFNAMLTYYMARVVDQKTLEEFKTALPKMLNAIDTFLTTYSNDKSAVDWLGSALQKEFTATSASIEKTLENIEKSGDFGKSLISAYEAYEKTKNLLSYDPGLQYEDVTEAELDKEPLTLNKMFNHYVSLVHQYWDPDMVVELKDFTDRFGDPIKKIKLGLFTSDLENEAKNICTALVKKLKDFGNVVKEINEDKSLAPQAKSHLFKIIFTNKSNTGKTILTHARMICEYVKKFEQKNPNAAKLIKAGLTDRKDVAKVFLLVYELLYKDTQGDLKLPVIRLGQGRDGNDEVPDIYWMLGLCLFAQLDVQPEKFSKLKDYLAEMVKDEKFRKTVISEVENKLGELGVKVKEEDGRIAEFNQLVSALGGAVDSPEAYSKNTTMIHSNIQPYQKDLITRLFTVKDGQ